jgi:hypothetical protein
MAKAKKTAKHGAKKPHAKPHAPKPHKGHGHKAGK